MIGGSHPTPAALLDLVEGGGTEQARRHVDACATCRTRVDEIRETVAMASAVEVPEPSPLFWDHLSARVGQAIAHDGEPQPQTKWLGWGPRVSLAAGVLALVVVAVVVTRHPEPFVGQEPAPVSSVGPVADDWDGAVASDVDDGTWALVTAISAELAEDEAESAALEPAPGMAERVVGALSRDEQGELVRLLEAELARRPS